MKSKIYPEVCCELCNEVIHNHFDCPVCKCYTGTDVYRDFDDFDDYIDVIEEIICEKCKTKFKIVSRNVDEVELELKEV